MTLSVGFIEPPYKRGDMQRLSVGHQPRYGGLQADRGSQGSCVGRLLIVVFLLFAAIPCPPLAAQNAQYGVALPFTFSGEFLDTQRAQYVYPDAPTAFGAFRLVAMPEVKLGSHWYGYGALQLRLTPYFYQDAYDDLRQIKFDVLQGYLGYSRTWNHTALNLKVGKLSSAFGAFPLRYDDMINPLIDQPLTYNYLLLQPSSSGAANYGLTPVTIYGLPAAEAELAWHRLDSRFQLTNSSPYNPVGFFQPGQHPQWTAGGGYTIRQGFRVGVSAYRGPWLSGTLASVIPTGLTAADFPASGIGTDIQFARGRWSISGEWDRFVFDFPHLDNASTLTFGYAEIKVILHPRWYAAFRPNYQTDNHPVVGGAQLARTFFPNRQAYEAVVGFRPDRYQLLKVGYEWAPVDNSEPNRNNVFGIQFVTSFNGLSKALR
jgi:hypothetical protein